MIWVQKKTKKNVRKKKNDDEIKWNNVNWKTASIRLHFHLNNMQTTAMKHQNTQWKLHGKWRHFQKWAMSYHSFSVVNGKSWTLSDIIICIQYEYHYEYKYTIIVQIVQQIQCVHTETHTQSFVWNMKLTHQFVLYVEMQVIPLLMVFIFDDRFVSLFYLTRRPERDRKRERKKCELSQDGNQLRQWSTNGRTPFIYTIL